MDQPTPPGTPFNFAQHLLAANAARAAKPAFVDDAGALSYGELDDRVRRLAAGLRALGIRREERVLLLMLDGTDWPVSFLGAIYAGIVPVAVNTLLTATTTPTCSSTRVPRRCWSRGRCCPRWRLP